MLHKLGFKRVLSINVVTVLFIICIFLLSTNYLNILSLREASEKCNRINSLIGQKTKILQSTIKTTTEKISKIDVPEETLQTERISKKKSKMKFGNILDVLPNTQDKKEFEHRFEITNGRRTKYVIGIPTVKREGVNYLVATMKSLIKALNSKERKDVVVVIFIAEVIIKFE